MLRSRLSELTSAIESTGPGFIVHTYNSVTGAALENEPFLIVV